jgi:rod shape determining protein RodA
LTILMVVGVPWQHIAPGALAAVAVALSLLVLPAAGVNVLHDYQKERLTSFLHLSDVTGTEGLPAEPGANRHRLSARRPAVANRRPRRGTTSSRAPHRLHLAVVGERVGFAGAALVLSLYALLMEGTRILTLSKNLDGAS